jgi:hypothetical protein
MEPRVLRGYYLSMRAMPNSCRLMSVLCIYTFALMGVIPRIGAQIVAVPEQTADQAWSELKNDTYDQRAHFSTGVNRLSARLDEQIRVLKAKRAGMTTDLKDWDFAMKGVEDSRALLTSRMVELGKADTPESWISARDNLGDAWVRSQQAVDKMNTTVTS